MRYGEERFAITSPKADHPPKIVGSALSVIAALCEPRDIRRGGSSGVCAISLPL
jgi:hypothetical protein